MTSVWLCWFVIMAWCPSTEPWIVMSEIALHDLDNLRLGTSGSGLCGIYTIIFLLRPAFADSSVAPAQVK